MQPIFRHPHQFHRLPIFLRSIIGLAFTSAATLALVGAGSAAQTFPTRSAAPLRRRRMFSFSAVAKSAPTTSSANGIVIGAEAMFDWLSNSQNAIVTATDPTGSVAANIGTSNARWLTTVSGRLGYAWDRVLLYAKGGGAWVATNSPAISVAGTPASFSSISNTTSSGYTAGFGVEWAFSGNWSVRAEYAYIGLPSQSFTVAPGTPTFGGDVITFSNRNISMVTGAVNYKFGGW